MRLVPWADIFRMGVLEPRLRFDLADVPQVRAGHQRSVLRHDSGLLRALPSAGRHTAWRRALVAALGTQRGRARGRNLHHLPPHLRTIRQDQRRTQHCPRRHPYACDWRRRWRETGRGYRAERQLPRIDRADGTGQQDPSRRFQARSDLQVRVLRFMSPGRRPSGHQARGRVGPVSRIASACRRRELSGLPHGQGAWRGERL
jgi:PAS domain-containing protein